MIDAEWWGRGQCWANGDSLIHDYTNENKWKDNSDEDCLYDVLENIAIKDSALIGVLIQKVYFNINNKSSKAMSIDFINDICICVIQIFNC